METALKNWNNECSHCSQCECHFSSPHATLKIYKHAFSSQNCNSYSLSLQTLILHSTAHSPESTLSTTPTMKINKTVHHVTPCSHLTHTYCISPSYYSHNSPSHHLNSHPHSPCCLPWQNPHLKRTPSQCRRKQISPISLSKSTTWIYAESTDTLWESNRFKCVLSCSTLLSNILFPT